MATRRFFTSGARLARLPLAILLLLLGSGWVAAAALMMQELPAKFPDAPAWQLPVAGICSGAPGVGLVLAGLWLLLLRAGTLIDAGRRTVYATSGPLGLRRQEVAAFAAVRAVRIRRVATQAHAAGFASTSSRGRDVSYPVELVTEGGAALLVPALTYPGARRAAEAAAGLIGVGVEDLTSGEALVREAGTLDEALGDRLRREGVATDVPPVPDALRPLVTSDVSGWTIERPRIPFGREHRLLLAVLGGAGVVGAAVCAVLGLLEDRELAAQDWYGMARFAFGAPLALAGAILLRALGASERIVVHPQGLTVTRRLLGIPWTRHLPAGEIEQVEVDRHGRPPGQDEPHLRLLGFGPRARAQSDRRTLTFGWAATEPELEWLVALVRAELARREG